MAKPNAFERANISTDKLYDGSSQNGALNPAFNNQYDVSINFGDAEGGNLLNYIKKYDKNGRGEPGQFLSLFCSEALLPGSQIQTSKVDGLRQGLSQDYAIYRRYPDINLTWYSTQDYFTNDIFNAWMEFISPLDIGSFGKRKADRETRKNSKNAGRRLQYPNSYKCGMQITALSRDGGSNFITYHIERAFPTSIIAAPLAYGKAELIKTTVSFKYENYFTERSGVGTVKDTAIILSEKERQAATEAAAKAEREANQDFADDTDKTVAEAAILRGGGSLPEVVIDGGTGLRSGNPLPNNTTA